MSESSGSDRWFFSFPSWPDLGMRVEVETLSGDRIEGDIDSSDSSYDEEGDEYPVCYVVTQAGIKVDFQDWKRWRFLSP